MLFTDENLVCMYVSSFHGNKVSTFHESLRINFADLHLPPEHVPRLYNRLRDIRVGDQ